LFKLILMHSESPSFASVQADIAAINGIAVIPQILQIICHTTGMGFAAVARVTDKQWIACSVKDNIAFGLKPGEELPLESTICNEIRLDKHAVIIDHVSQDPLYSCHHTPAMYGFESYISVPIFRKDGNFFGTLCAIDPKPNKLDTPEVIDMFELYADLIAFHLNAAEQIQATEARLSYEQQTSNLRNQFIAILGHDLRNPIGAIAGSTQVLNRMPLNEKVIKFVNIIQDATHRVQGLIDNMLDFARGHMGEGIQLNWQQEPNLAGVLLQVCNELSVIWPDRSIETNIQINKPVWCDSRRIAQLFSNLLSNAFTHGAKNTPIRVEALCDEDGMTLSVANGGEPIPAAAMERLFQPFSRSEVKPNQQGLGLGLYISSEIAGAHNGGLSVTSTAEETRFSFFLPERTV
jgi:signal transduction histidine kinase